MTIAKQAYRTGIFVAAMTAVTAQAALAVAVGNAAAVGRRLAATATIPVVLPATVPDSITSTEIYAHVQNVQRNGYQVALSSTPHCTGARYCSFGLIMAGPSVGPPQTATQFRFFDGANAYYDRPSIWWRRSGTWYRLTVYGAGLPELRAVAIFLQTYKR